MTRAPDGAKGLEGRQSAPRSDERLLSWIFGCFCDSLMTQRIPVSWKLGCLCDRIYEIDEHTKAP